jgi:hypothetical protein
MKSELKDRTKTENDQQLNKVITDFFLFPRGKTTEEAQWLPGLDIMATLLLHRKSKG